MLLPEAMVATEDSQSQVWGTHAGDLSLFLMFINMFSKQKVPQSQNENSFGLLSYHTSTHIHVPTETTE